VDIGAQIRQLRSGVDVAVGTPGRVIDLIQRGCLDLSQVSSILLFIVAQDPPIYKAAIAALLFIGHAGQVCMQTQQR
jgi:hypothetical protein